MIVHLFKHHVILLLLGLLIGCNQHSDSLPSSPGTESSFNQPTQPNRSQESLAQPPVVLFDSYHAHNFIHRGLRSGEYSYHSITGLRRAVELLRQRGCEVRETLVGPITKELLSGVNCIVINLPSMDRPPFLVDEVILLEEYVRLGGGIVFITDHSNCYYHQYHLLPLLNRLGIRPTFETVCELGSPHQLSDQGPGWLLIDQFQPHPITRTLHAIAIQTGGRVIGDSVIASTGPMAWADMGAVPFYGDGDIGLYGDMTYSSAEERGPQGIVLAQEIDAGRVTVISDQNCLGDALIAYADNHRLWLNSVSWTGRIELELKSPASAQHQDRWNAWCWEPISVVPKSDSTQNRFQWGGDDEHQFHSFWVWLNRTQWTEASDQLRNPSELQGMRELLFVTDGCLHYPECQQAVQKTLLSGGRVVWLTDLVPTDGQIEVSAQAIHPVESTLDASDAFMLEIVDTKTYWRARESLDRQQSQELLAVMLVPFAEHADPDWTPHEQSEIVLVDSNLLRNASFLSPTQQPDRRQQKLEQRLTALLFE